MTKKLIPTGLYGTWLISNGISSENARYKLKNLNEDNNKENNSENFQKNNDEHFKMNRSKYNENLKKYKIPWYKRYGMYGAFTAANAGLSSLLGLSIGYLTGGNSSLFAKIGAGAGAALGLLGGATAEILGRDKIMEMTVHEYISSFTETVEEVQEMSVKFIKEFTFKLIQKHNCEKIYVTNIQNPNSIRFGLYEKMFERSAILNKNDNTSATHYNRDLLITIKKCNKEDFNYVIFCTNNEKPYYYAIKYNSMTKTCSDLFSKGTLSISK